MKKPISSIIPMLVVIITFSAESVFAQIDYGTQIQPIFNASCVGCHGGTSGVFLDNYNDVMNSVGSQYGRAIVTPGNATDSPLYDKLLPNPQFGNRMPSGGSLSEAQISLIRDWINQGALETIGTNIHRETTPVTIHLHQNYPNPFNPSTIIAFDLSNETFVEIGIFTADGKEVRRLVNQHYPAGAHSVTFNADGLSSGVYLYRLQADNQQIARTMMLIR